LLQADRLGQEIKGHSSYDWITHLILTRGHPRLYSRHRRTKVTLCLQSAGNNSYTVTRTVATSAADADGRRETREEVKGRSMGERQLSRRREPYERKNLWFIFLEETRHRDDLSTET